MRVPFAPLTPEQSAELDNLAEHSRANPAILHKSNVPANDPLLLEVISLGHRLNNIAVVSAKVDTRLCNSVEVLRKQCRRQLVYIILLTLSHASWCAALWIVCRALTRSA